RRTRRVARTEMRLLRGTAGRGHHDKEVQVRELVAVLAVVAAFVTAATAQAASHTRLTLSVSTFKVLYGNPVTLSGRAPNGMAGQRVTVWARRAVASPAKVATVHTRVGGRWSVALRPAIG